MSVILTSKMLHHFPIIFCAKNRLGGGGNKCFEARKFSKQNLEAFYQILARADWNSVLTSEATQEAYTNFFENIF
jgi:hypothetical protein